MGDGGLWETHPAVLAGGLVFWWSTCGSPTPQSGLNQIWRKELNWKSVLRERWTDEKFEQAQRASCFKDQTKEVKDNWSNLWQLGIFDIVVSVDFILFNWIRFPSEATCGKMVISTRFRCRYSEWMIIEGQCDVKDSTWGVLRISFVSNWNSM